MNFFLKITATFHLVIFSCLPHFTGEISHDLMMKSSAPVNETPMIAQTKGDDFLFMLKSRLKRDIKFNKPEVFGTSITALPDATADRKDRSYFLSNNIQTILPLIQYKVPLSEHTEAG